MLNIYTLALGFVLLWQTPQRPAFRSEVNYVELDVSVTDKSGARVRGLTKDDFEVLENGKPQAVSAFTAVHLPMPAARAAGERFRLSDASVASNAGLAEGRVYVIVMDYGTLSLDATPKVRRQAAQFVTDFIGPDDLAAVVNLGTRSQATEFTANKARLLAALNVLSEFSGSARDAAKDVASVASGMKNDDEFADAVAAFAEMESSRQATEAISRFRILGGVGRYLSGLEGRRKTIVYVSQGIDADPPQVARNIGTLAQDALSGELRRLIESLQSSNVTVYGIDPRGLSSYDPYDGGGSAVALSDKFGPDYLAPMRSLRRLSEDTGGFATIGFNNLADPYRRIVEDSSSYYVLGYESNQAFDGGFHKVSVRVRGRDVEARTRDRIEAAKPSAKKDGGDIALVDAWRGSDIKSLLARPLPAGDLGLKIRATASAIGVRGRDAVIQLSVEVDGAGFAFQPASEVADSIDVAFQAFDINRKSAASRQDHVQLALSAATRDDVIRRGWRYVTEFTVPPGLYELKIAAAETNGHHAGSVFLDVPVADTSKAPLSIIGMALTSQAARTVPTAGATPTVRAASQAPLTPARSFSRADTITVLAGIVDTLAGDRDVTAVVRLRSLEGKVAIEVPATLKSANLRAGAPPNAFALPLAPVEPGDYEVVVEVTSAGKTVTKRLPISVVR